MKTSVILNCYGRPHTLRQQYEAIMGQTVQPCEILIWKNTGLPIDQFDQEVLRECKVADCNSNLGVWSRFSYALNASGDFIVVFDDDTIPGKQWIENCLNENAKQPALYGTIGVDFYDLDYYGYNRTGWANPNETAQQVDIVGHSWAFQRELLGAFHADAKKPLSLLCGEDMHFSYSIQKYLKLPTIVPPHPKDNMEMWGSKPETAYLFGVDNVAISCKNHSKLFGESLKHYYNLGWKLKHVK